MDSANTIGSSYIMSLCTQMFHSDTQKHIIDNQISDIKFNHQLREISEIKCTLKSQVNAEKYGSKASRVSRRRKWTYTQGL